MKKKSLVAMGLAGVMTVGMCVPVLAETLDQSNTSKEIGVDFTIDQSYSITIPTKLEVGTDQKDISITATGNLIEGQSINVKINGITNDGVSLDYYKKTGDQNAVEGKKTSIKVFKGSDQELTTSDAVAATFSNGADPKKNATLTNAITGLKLGAQPDTQAGYYKGTVTFEVEVASES